MSYSPWPGLTSGIVSAGEWCGSGRPPGAILRGADGGSAGRGCRATVAWLVVWLSLMSPGVRADDGLEVGFAHIDITPELRADAAVWLAGYYPGRAATGVHDPLFARCVVLKSGAQKIAWVSVDLIGLQFPAVQELRKRLTDFDYVLVASTHNHEGPDVIGVWGQSFLHRGVNDDYLALVLARMEQAVRRAEKHVRPARASWGTAADESLLRDNRLPIFKDGVLRLLRFADPRDAATVGLVVQWNCHPEALGADNSLVTADFPAATIAALERRFECARGVFQRRCRRIAGTADRSHSRRAWRDAARGRLRVCTAVRGGGGGFGGARCGCREADDHNSVQRRGCARGGPHDQRAVPLGSSAGDRTARRVRLERRGAALGEPLRAVQADGVAAIETEVAGLRLGDLYVLAIPGEIYPELVYGHLEDPPPPGVDFPTAPLEPTVRDIVPGDQWMLFGLANDEIGYIMPRRQWDRRPPYAYGLISPQYGEINSCGPDVALVIMTALRQCVAALPAPRPAAGH